jgi:formate/nitrite transporter FocA (FNT family)
LYFLPAGFFANVFTKAASGLTKAQISSLNRPSNWTDNIITVTLGNYVCGAILVGMATGLYF